MLSLSFMRPNIMSFNVSLTTFFLLSMMSCPIMGSYYSCWHDSIQNIEVNKV